MSNMEKEAADPSKVKAKEGQVTGHLTALLRGFLQKLVTAIQLVSGGDFEGMLEYWTKPRSSCSLNPKPGNFVPVCHHQQLEYDFHEFCDGEIAAFEVYDPLMAGEDSGDSEDSTPVFIYTTVLYELGDCDEDAIFAKRYHIDLGPDRGGTDVSLTRLYKIISKTTPGEQTFTSSCSAQEQQTASFKESNDQALDMRALHKDVRQTLAMAWRVCTEEEFRCVTKRLALKWHPDRHSGKESACTCLIETIFHCAERLGRIEKKLGKDGSAGAVRDVVDGRLALSYGLSYGLTKEKFSAGNYARRATFQMGQGVGNPQPGEGWRWLHTAHRDLTAAQASRGICAQGHNWVCFLCHQAAEKAMKAVLYLRDADNDCLQSHNLPHLARRVGDATLRRLAEQMEFRVGPHTRMRYPDVLVFPSVPADVYSGDDASMACALAGQVLERAKGLMRGG
ncbi:uncharacterized protein LOC143281029 [Babylonia areolata]|uniref:uncharacterized protein LOC143281029 n=1 Tax=Babylonia areolata TaxID=304850 RepID=UPI003FD2A9D8